MNISILDNKNELGRIAAENGANLLRDVLQKKSAAAIIVATGASQFEMLETLIQQPDIDWSRVTVFHLDEYIGLPDTHPASFRKYLRERFVVHLPALKEFVEINGSAANTETELKRLNQYIIEHPIDICFAGIGENGHLAFNDPPADFDVKDPYIVVNLDEACRKQQLGEGWFASLDEVPTQAISMSISHIMKSQNIILSVPDQRKAEAVKHCIEGKVTNMHPASILQTHPACQIYLDKDSASGLLPR